MKHNSQRPRHRASPPGFAGIIVLSRVTGEVSHIRKPTRTGSRLSPDAAPTKGSAFGVGHLADVYCGCCRACSNLTLRSHRCGVPRFNVESDTMRKGGRCSVDAAAFSCEEEAGMVLRESPARASSLIRVRAACL